MSRGNTIPIHPVAQVSTAVYSKSIWLPSPSLASVLPYTEPGKANIEITCSSTGYRYTVPCKHAAFFDNSCFPLFPQCYIVYVRWHFLLFSVSHPPSLPPSPLFLPSCPSISPSLPPFLPRSLPTLLSFPLSLKVSVLAQKPTCSHCHEVHWKTYFRKTHVDCHYALALYRYVRQFSVKVRDYTTFVSQDDKHSVKVGEPEYLVAAVECGKAVLVGLNEKMVAGDHDFTKFTLTPSVNLVISTPETIEGSFYRGKVYAGLKDSTFQHSSSIRHSTKLNKIF